jgi:hypothetical protein
MAIKLTDKTNTDPASVDWPFGEVRDKTISVGGTKYDKNTISDHFQFFEKLMSEAGVVHNGELDNEANGFQLWEAFGKFTRKYRVIQGFIDNSSFTELYNDTGETVTFDYVNQGNYDLNITGTAFTANKTSVITTNQNTAQGSSTLIVTGGGVESISKVKITCMAFINMDSGGATAAGVNVGTGLHPDPIYVEIRIHD